MDLLFPSASDGNNNNRFPALQKGGTSVDKFLVSDELVAFTPIGTDSYFLLASAEPVTGYDQIFNQEGVRGIISGDTDNPLYKLMDMGNESSARGLKNTTPTNWALKKLSIVTKR